VAAVSDGLAWPIACSDAVGRNSAVWVIPESGQVSITLPAGESATLTVAQAALLQSALGLAQLAAGGAL
jgi:hypothetical protein